MQVNSGLRSVLAARWAYRLAMNVFRKKGARRWFVDEVCVLPEKVVDIGCGAGELAGLLPPARFIGLDISDAYIAAARRKYEPCYLAWQSGFSRRMMSVDAAKASARKGLVGPVFPRMDTRIAASVNRLGYTCIIGECRLE